MPLIMPMMSSICSGSTMSSGQVVVDLGVRQVALFQALADQQLDFVLLRGAIDGHGTCWRGCGIANLANQIV
jgi:hypothetical protein